MCSVTIYKGEVLWLKEVAEYEYNAQTKILTCFNINGERTELQNINFLHWSEMKDKLTIS